MTIAPRTFALTEKVTYKGRPAVVITSPGETATGALCYGIRYTDIPAAFEDDPRMPSLRRPVAGSTAIAHAKDLS